MPRSKKLLDYSRITDYLFVGVTPRKSDYANLSDDGIRLVINMRAETLFRRSTSIKEITEIRVPTFDSRFLPIKPTKLIGASSIASETIKNGNKVYVFCRRGRHRSIVMAAAILISQGYSANSAIDLLKEHRPAADVETPYIRSAIVEFDNYWKGKQKVID